MLRDIDCLLNMTSGPRRIAGIAFGCLNQSQQVDLPRATQIISHVNSRLSADPQTSPPPRKAFEFVFHRAIDLTFDPINAVEKLADLGVTRILSSGGQTTAIEGANTIAKMIQCAEHRIEILPAAGISADNVTSLIQQTQATQVHGSFSHQVKDTAQPVAANEYSETAERLVRQTRQAIDAN
jgi:copper homeostasis protein